MVLEFSLIGLTLLLLVLDIFIPKEKKGVALANIAMVGLAGLFAFLPFQWGHFGEFFSGTFEQDGVGLCFKALFLLAGFLTVFMAREYRSQLRRGRDEFVLLILFALIGMFFLVSANDFLLFFVALETLSISSYVMTAYLRDSRLSIEAGVKYLVMGALSTSIFLFGLSFIYGSTGHTSYAGIETALSTMTQLPISFMFGTVLVIASLGFKISAVPFQLWAPDIYQGAPTPVTAFLAIGSKAAGFAALVRLLLTIWAPAHAQLAVVFGMLSALTIIYGNLGAIPQTNIKRLMGYSSIGHAGYLLIGLAAFGQSGREALLFYLFSYLFSTGGVFLVLAALSSHMKTDEISELAGLSKRSPVLAAGMMLSLMSLAGVPPLSGFFAKFYLLWAGMKSGFFWLIVVGVLNVVTSLYYYLKIVKVLYVDEPKDLSALSVSFDQKAMQYFTMFGMVLLGIFQGPFVRIAERAFSTFLR